MSVTTTDQNVRELAADAVVIGVYADAPLTGMAAEFNTATNGLLTRLIEAKEITGKKYETATLLGPSGIKAGIALTVGLGAKDGFDRGVAFRAASTAAKALAGKERSGGAVGVADGWAAETGEGALCGWL